jgi:hypothetical protein
VWFLFIHVHVTCALPIPGTQEGYGQPRLCLDSSDQNKSNVKDCTSVEHDPPPPHSLEEDTADVEHGQQLPYSTHPPPPDSTETIPLPLMYDMNEDTEKTNKRLALLAKLQQPKGTITGNSTRNKLARDFKKRKKMRRTASGAGADVTGNDAHTKPAVEEQMAEQEVVEKLNKRRKLSQTFKRRKERKEKKRKKGNSYVGNTTETADESNIAVNEHDALWEGNNEEVWDHDDYQWDYNYNTWVYKKRRPKRKKDNTYKQQRNWLLGMLRNWNSQKKDNMVANITLRRNELHKVQMYRSMHV